MYKRQVLKAVRTVVLDEADRMLDMGFIHDVTRILDKIPSRENLGMFSATISREVMAVSYTHLDVYKRQALYPSLVQIRTDPTYPRALKGVKAEAAVTVRRGDDTLAQNRGEVLFTEYGVSGPVIFDISRTAATGGDGLTVTLDLFPDWAPREALDWLRQRRQSAGDREAGTLLTGALHSRLGQMVCKAAGFTNRRAAGLSDGDLRRIAAQVKGFALPITGVCGFDQAQVTACLLYPSRCV